MTPFGSDSGPCRTGTARWGLRRPEVPRGHRAARAAAARRGRLARMARRAPRDVAGGLARPAQEGWDGHRTDLRAGCRGGPLLRLDRRSGSAPGRCELRAAAYAGPATAVVPEDLASAIASVPAAQAMFDVLTSANRFALIYRVQDAKRPETRARRIATFVE